MPSRTTPRTGARRRKTPDRTPDLFATALDGAVTQAFTETTAPSHTPASPNPPALSTPVPETPASAPQTVSPLPARMLNEFVYCPRLYFYEHVEGIFIDNADTTRGQAIHTRVDQGNGALPAAAPTDTNSPDDTTDIHSRSVTLSSERLGVIAKMDLIESSQHPDGTLGSVQPVDYKVGAPRIEADTIALWDTDRMQLGLQCLILRDNGYRCHTGIIYYRTTKQRVPLDLTPELETWILGHIAAARTCAQGSIPPPLIDSPKCARCSLAPVCLPDETRYLHELQPPLEKETPDPAEPTVHLRRLIAARDDTRALYLNTQGYRVGCTHAVLKIKDKDRTLDEVRLIDVCHVALFGNIQVSTQAIQRLCEAGIPITYFSMGGWFYGITRGHTLKNVLLRIEQFRAARDPQRCLAFARQFVWGKIHNHRVLYMRNHIAPDPHPRHRLGQAREDALRADTLDTLLGVEGAAAATYFQHFSGLIRTREDEDYLEGIAPPPRGAPEFTFDFTTRNRRPPTDPVNALLSLAYSLLAKECTLAAYAVGLDPYVGFYHQPRHGRPALALDIMEEFRPIIAESAVLSAINNRFVSTRDFVTAGRAVNLTPAGRKRFFQCFEGRINSLVTHPVFNYKVSYRRAIELQFRILARALTGEIPSYQPFRSR